MKRFLIGAVLAIATLFTFTTESGAAVSINIGEPGFYGQLNIGGYPPPRVYYRRPKIINYEVTNRPPIYLRVRPGHARQWRRYCRLYNACNERVYFVRHDWYHREYAPRYQKFNRGNHGPNHRDDDRRDDRHDWKDDRRDWNDDRHDWKDDRPRH